MFQRGNSKIPWFEFGHSPLNKNEDDRPAMFGHGGTGGAEQSLMLQPNHVSGEVRNRHVAVEKFHSAAVRKDGPDNREVNTNSCKIFGISLTEKVPASKETESGDVNYPSPFLSLKQQVPKSLGHSCATVSAPWSNFVVVLE
jgi:auxin response factor